MNNTLIPKEAIALDNKIANYEFMINEQLSKLEPFKKELTKDEFESTIKNYHSSIDEIIEKENKHKTIAKKVEQLYELTPREFEEWTANLFNSLGYEKITLTPQSNDKGIDVLAEKNGMKIAVQCKKFKGLVVSPDIQKFIGAIKYAEVDKGFLITTGTYSVEAEKMAISSSIEIYDKVRLVDLIEEAMNTNN